MSRVVYCTCENIQIFLSTPITYLFLFFTDPPSHSLVLFCSKKRKWFVSIFVILNSKRYFVIMGKSIIIFLSVRFAYQIAPSLTTPQLVREGPFVWMRSMFPPFSLHVFPLLPFFYLLLFLSKSF